MSGERTHAVPKIISMIYMDPKNLQLLVISSIGSLEDDLTRNIGYLVEYHVRDEHESL